MNSSRILVGLAILCLLMVPAYSEQVQKTCTCTSGLGNYHGTNGLCCCCMEHAEKSCISQPCNCMNLISSTSSIYIYDLECVGNGEARPRIYSRQSPSTVDSSSVAEGRFIGSSQAGSNDRPPDLDVIEYLPPSAKRVLDVLAANGPLTQKELISKTALPPRTVRYALSRLRGENILEKRFCFRDARQSLYGLNGTIAK